MNVILKKEIHIETELVEIEVPSDFMGKDVEILFTEKPKDKANDLDLFFSRFNYDLSKLVFNRDELYER
ncbi:MAG: hypothetical protein ACM3SY_10945 [Candidatus Omnitrophota bacterium]